MFQYLRGLRLSRSEGVLNKYLINIVSELSNHSCIAAFTCFNKVVKHMIKDILGQMAWPHSFDLASFSCCCHGLTKQKIGEEVRFTGSCLHWISHVVQWKQTLLHAGLPKGMWSRRLWTRGRQICQRQYVCTLLQPLRRSRHVRMVAMPDLFQLVSWKVLSFLVPFI